MAAIDAIRIIFSIFDIRETSRITSYELVKLLEESRDNNSMEMDILHII